MRVSDYIRDLLYKENCVILPGFGGFVVNYEGSKIDFNSNEMHPPKRLLAFNQKLTNNDGLLVNHIAKQENITYQEAEKKVASFVAEQMKMLDKGNKVTIDGIGSLKSIKSNIVFTPDRNINFNRDAYGLESFKFKIASDSISKTSLACFFIFSSIKLSK